MSNSSRIRPTRTANSKIKAPHSFNGDTHKLGVYYDDWAEEYNHDAAGEGYRGPSVLADLTVLCHNALLKSTRRDTTVLDAGCGTGLVGVELSQRGFSTIDGVDLSPGMVEQAQQTRCYRNLVANVDLGRPEPIAGLSRTRYDMVVSCGLFLHGHLDPNGLWSLIGLVRKGGLLLAATRESYVDNAGFDTIVDQLAEERLARCELKLSGAAYIDEEPAIYWVIRALTNEPGLLRV